MQDLWSEVSNKAKESSSTKGDSMKFLLQRHVKEKKELKGIMVSQPIPIISKVWKKVKATEKHMTK